MANIAYGKLPRLPVAVVHADLEKFLTAYLRREVAGLAGNPYPGGFISNEFWDGKGTPPPFQIIVRDDGGPKTSTLTKEPTVGITVLGSDALGKAAVTDLALNVCALMDQSARVEPGNPIAAVLSSTGPFKVPDESGQQRRYMTFGLSVVGKAFS